MASTNIININMFFLRVQPADVAAGADGSDGATSAAGAPLAVGSADADIN